jgi:hypothetical protein
VPHPAGDIDMHLTRLGREGLTAEVTLPPGVAGELLWAGQRLRLHPGRQELTICPNRDGTRC